MKTGRPRKTQLPAAAYAIVRGIENGLTVEAACKAAQVVRRTYTRWRAKWPELVKLVADAFERRRKAAYDLAMAELEAERKARLVGELPTPAS